MPSLLTKSGPRSRRLTEVARHVVLPDGIETTAWPSVAGKLRAMGIVFDPWQEGAGRAMLAKRADGKYAASVGGVVLSIPRQVGKTFMIGAIVFALCLIHPRMKVIWTAHHTNTADETFEAMQEMARRHQIAPYVRRVMTGGAKNVIIFTNGSRVEFGARDSGFGRGKTRVSILVLDEAQILTEKALENIVPTLNQGANPLMFMMGTPPRPIDSGEAFRNKRERALSGASSNVLYVEMSADRGSKLDDRKQWAKANPSFPGRTDVEAMLRMREAFSEDSFRREALGIWDENAVASSLIKPGEWARLADSFRPDGRRVFGVKFSVDGALVGLAGAVRPDEGPVLVGGIRIASTAEGLGWLVEYLVQRKDRTSQLVIDGRSGAPALLEMLSDAGLRARSKVSRDESRFIRTPSLSNYTAAHAMFHQAVVEGDLFHDDMPDLNSQVGVAIKRAIGTQGGWGWRGIGEGDDVTLLDAATLAFWGAKTTKRKARGES